MSRYYVNPKTPCSHFVLDRESDMICSVFVTYDEAATKARELNARWNPQTRTLTVSNTTQTNS
jgi:hypothetical protein